MYENKCVICGQSILGYWYEIGKKNVCQSCAAFTTVYDLFQRGIIDIKPDIVDTEATLVTKDDDRYPFNDDGYHYTDEDVAAALKIINDVKSHGCKTEREFFDECQKLWDAGASDTDNSLLILRKQYEDIMPTPRYEGDTGNDTWDVMYHLWESANYTDGYLATAQKIIADIKSHGCKTEREFFDECQKLRGADSSDTDNPLLALYEQYNEVMSSLRYGVSNGYVKQEVIDSLWA